MTLGLTKPQRNQIVLITLGAVGMFLFLRFLPTGTNLNHMDFRVTGRNSIDFCDPLNPQFIPVVAVKSPVTMTLAPTDPGEMGQPYAPGKEVRLTLTLKTGSGKAIAPEDLLIAHTKLLHLLIVDPWLDDYQHVHPEPAKRAGEWTFAFTPKREGMYRVFADFTPAATARSLYASADLPIGRAGLPAGYSLTLQHEDNWTTQREGYRFELRATGGAIRARQPADLQLIVTEPKGARVPMQPVMGAFAHLVAFDESRSGFAHLHPMEADLTQAPDAVKPTLNFKITIPRPGRYVVWAQVNLGGKEVFAPFWFEVAE